MSKAIPVQEWEWFGNNGHLIVGHDCRFHLCTRVGKWLVSTVGQYLPDETVREIHAQVRDITLEGRGDARLADFMRKCGYIEIGYNRTFETMVFEIDGDKRCTRKGCGCGLPVIIPSELDSDAYSDAGSATRGHMILCGKAALGTYTAKEER